MVKDVVGWTGTLPYTYPNVKLSCVVIQITLVAGDIAQSSSPKSILSTFDGFLIVLDQHNVTVW